MTNAAPNSLPPADLLTLAADSCQPDACQRAALCPAPGSADWLDDFKWPNHAYTVMLRNGAYCGAERHENLEAAYRRAVEILERKISVVVRHGPSGMRFTVGELREIYDSPNETDQQRRATGNQP